jgi:hypothetical protein
VTELSNERCAAEDSVAREFAALYAWFSKHPASRPQTDETWERTLRVARNCAPMLADLRERGLDLVRLDQYTPPGIDRLPLYQTVIEWLPRIQDPLSLTICLIRLTEPGARRLVKKHRELLLSLARQWNERLRKDDHEHTLSVLSQCLMMAVREQDVPQVIEWAKDRLLSRDARASYVLDLQRFAKKPGCTRDALIELLADCEVGNAAVWALAGALKKDAVPLLCELRTSSPHESVRTAAKAVVKKLEARSSKVTLPIADPKMLPQGYGSFSIELDTDRIPELLSSLERGIGGKLRSGVAEQLARSAAQIRRGGWRFHIVQIVLGSGATSQLGFGLYGEDEDVIMVEVFFDQEFCEGVHIGMKQVLDNDSE